MWKIQVVSQSRISPTQYDTIRDGDKFLCPLCGKKGQNVWIDINFIDFGGTDISTSSKCPQCGTSFSVSR